VHLLLTRPRSDATATALQARGHTVTIAPLMAFEALDWHAEIPEVIMLTSPQAAEAAARAAAWQVPAYAVGSATAVAARSAGFSDVRDGGGTAQALVDRIAADGFGRVLHLAGADRTPIDLPDALIIDVVVVYRARLLPLGGMPDVDAVLLYSARTAAHFAAEADRLGVARANVTIFALSPAVAAAAGPDWKSMTIAAAPNEASMLAAIDAACQKAPRTV
jgi:uroporphyrinogen-III synthase